MGGNQEDLDLRFGEDPREVKVKYTGMEAPSLHMDVCITGWLEKNVPEREWVHRFIQTLDLVPRNWYIHQE